MEGVVGGGTSRAWEKSGTADTVFMVGALGMFSYGLYDEADEVVVLAIVDAAGGADGAGTF